MENFKYRFKTEQEFLNEYGKDWKLKLGSYWNPSMNYLFGSVIKKDIKNLDFFKLTLIDRNSIFGFWIISPSMLKLNIKEPDYKPIKLIKNEIQS